MYDILKGVRVVEVASFVLVPSAGAVRHSWDEITRLNQDGVIN